MTKQQNIAAADALMKIFGLYREETMRDVFRFSILNYQDGELILMCAFGYALGRKTYVVSTIVDTILNEWENLKPHTKKYFKDRIKEAIETGSAGMQMDVEQWEKILNKG